MAAFVNTFTSCTLWQVRVWKSHYSELMLNCHKAQAVLPLVSINCTYWRLSCYAVLQEACPNAPWSLTFLCGHAWQTATLKVCQTLSHWYLMSWQQLQPGAIAALPWTCLCLIPSRVFMALQPVVALDPNLHGWPYSRSHYAWTARELACGRNVEKLFDDTCLCLSTLAVQC